MTENPEKTRIQKIHKTHKTKALAVNELGTNAIPSVTRDYTYTVLSNNRSTCRVRYVHDTDANLAPYDALITLYKNDGTEKTAQELRTEIEEIWPAGYWGFQQKPDPVDVVPMIGVPYDVNPVTDYLEEEAPNDGMYYARTGTSSTTAAKTAGVQAIPDAPADGEIYARRSLAWQSFEPFTDAPTDGKSYSRKDGAWSEVSDSSDWEEIISQVEYGKGILLYRQDKTVDDLASVNVRQIESSLINLYNVSVSVSSGNLSVYSTNETYGLGSPFPSFKVNETATHFEVYSQGSGGSIFAEITGTNSSADSTRVLLDSTVEDWSATVGTEFNTWGSDVLLYSTGPGFDVEYRGKVYRYINVVDYINTNTLNIDGKNMPAVPSTSDGKYYAMLDGAWVDITAKLNP